MAGISFSYVEFPSTLSQQTFVLGVSSSQGRSYGLISSNTVQESQSCRQTCFPLSAHGLSAATFVAAKPLPAGMPASSTSAIFGRHIQREEAGLPGGGPLLAAVSDRRTAPMRLARASPVVSQVAGQAVKKPPS